MQTSTYVKISILFKTKERTNVKTKFIQQQLDKYTSGKLSRSDFVESVSYRNASF